MKGQYLENPENYNPHHNHPQMFNKFPPPHLHFPFATNKHSDDAISPGGDPPATSKKPKTAAGDDGSTVEVPRRPRGRPPGSKNKPKSPLIITREPEPPAMSPYILELPANSDIVDSLTRFTRRRGIGICVLTATGTVANVTLKQPAPARPGATVTFHGRFDILSLSAVVLSQTASFHSNDFGIAISLAGPQGQIIGGMVVGPLISVGTVFVVATSFNSPSFHRLPLDNEEEEEDSQMQAAAGDVQQSSSPVSGGSNAGGQMGMYSNHMGSDVMWASSVRPHLPRPY